MGMIRERTCIESVHYGVHDHSGRYEILDREACGIITGPGAIAKEDIDGENWRMEEEVM